MKSESPFADQTNQGASLSETEYTFYEALFGKLDPDELRKQFLHHLLTLQHVERGSIWVRENGCVLCIEAAGREFAKIQGVRIDADRPSIVGWVIEHGEMTVAEAGKDPRHYRELEKELDVKSTLILCYPLVLKDGSVYGAVEIIDTSAGGDRLNLDSDYLDVLGNIVDIGAIALSSALEHDKQLAENKRLKMTLEAVRSEAPIIGESPPLQAVRKKAANYAKYDFPVLITGESGTGKELIAKEIHVRSGRTDQPYLVQNCSAIPDTLLESELFGYKKGAFTGATRDNIGLFAAAHGGTVFLDEIGDMPVGLQARILRVIENGEVKPLGGAGVRKVDVRIISATNQQLTEMIEENTFREDLYYRLSVLPLEMPSLRERREDIPLLLDFFIRRECLRLNIRPKSVEPCAMEVLETAPWRGNIRELENFVKYLLATVEGELVRESDIPDYVRGPRHCARPDYPQDYPGEDAEPKAPAMDGLTWDEMERAYVTALLERNRWNVTKAAKEADVNRSTFDSRMKKLGISRE